MLARVHGAVAARAADAVELARMPELVPAVLERSRWVAQRAVQRREQAKVGALEVSGGLRHHRSQLVFVLRLARPRHVSASGTDVAPAEEALQATREGADPLDARAVRELLYVLTELRRVVLKAMGLAKRQHQVCIICAELDHCECAGTHDQLGGAKCVEPGD